MTAYGRGIPGVSRVPGDRQAVFPVIGQAVFPVIGQAVFPVIGQAVRKAATRRPGPEASGPMRGPE